jgi:hypothetical protein
MCERKKLQTSNSKLQRSLKQQWSIQAAGTMHLDFELDVWSFFGAWILVLGASLKFGVWIFTTPPPF